MIRGLAGLTLALLASTAMAQTSAPSGTSEVQLGFGGTGQVAYFTGKATVVGNSLLTADSSGNLISGSTTAHTAQASSSALITAGTFDASNYPTGVGASIVGGDTTAFKVGLMGVAVNTLAGNPANYPNAIGAFGYLNSAGNNMFGLTSIVSIYTAGNGSNEFDARNYSAAPSATLPPDYSTGTLNSNVTGLYLGAGGTFNALLAIGIGQDAGAPTHWLNGIYFFANQIVSNTIRDDSSSTNVFVVHGAHTTGIDMSSGTFSSSAIKSPGFTVDGSGDVGIASATPLSSPFQVKTAADRVIRMYDNSAAGVVESTNLAQSAYSAISVNGSTLQLATGASTAMSFDASQNVIFGHQATPATAATACTANTFVFDTGFIYVCTASGAWKRVAIATW